MRRYLQIIIIFFYGCSITPCSTSKGLKAINIEIDKSFLYGVYSLESTNNFNYFDNESKIILHKNGDLEIINFSRRIFNSIDPKGKINIGGKWDVHYNSDTMENKLTLTLRFNKKYKIEDMLSSFDLYLKNDKPVMLFNFGDPDECNYLRFIKNET